MELSDNSIARGFIETVADFIRSGRYDEADLSALKAAVEERQESIFKAKREAVTKYVKRELGDDFTVFRVIAQEPQRPELRPHQEEAVAKLSGTPLTSPLGRTFEKRVAVGRDDIEDLARAACEEARLGHVALRLDYEDRERNTTSRVIEPKAVVSRFGGNLYLSAIDVEKDEARLFMLDRIKRLEVC